MSRRKWEPAREACRTSATACVEAVNERLRGCPDAETAREWAAEVVAGFLAGAAADAASAARADMYAKHRTEVEVLAKRMFDSLAAYLVSNDGLSK